MKVAYQSVTTSQEIWTVFQSCVEHVVKDCGLNEREMKKFFDEWTRKMVHARLGEFIKCYNCHQAATVRKRTKGGQSLRDELFCATKRNKLSYDYGVKSKKNIKKTNGTVISGSNNKREKGKDTKKDKLTNATSTKNKSKNSGVSAVERETCATTSRVIRVENKACATSLNADNENLLSAEHSVANIAPSSESSAKTPVRKSGRVSRPTSRKLDMYSYD